MEQDDHPYLPERCGGFPGRGRGFPGGGGGFPRGGRGFPGGGGPLGGLWGPPPAPMQPTNNGKLVGDPPTIYDGDRKKTQTFVNQWDVYWGVNSDNALIMNPYQQAMLFLTYMKGTNVNKYVVAVNQWLNQQLHGGIPTTDEQLWAEVTASFSQ